MSKSKAKAVCPFCGSKTDTFIMFRGDVVGCKFCGINAKVTNADHIRCMTDNELAEFLNTFSKGCDYCVMPCKAFCRGRTCLDAWLCWLKDEVSIDS